MVHAREWTHRQITPALPRPLLEDVALVEAISPYYHRGIGPFLLEAFARHTADRLRARAGRPGPPRAASRRAGRFRPSPPAASPLSRWPPSPRHTAERIRARAPK